MKQVGCVVIGRNEGERLRACIESVLAQSRAVVYVDSGSSDDSVAIARSLGVATLELDPSRSFTAARSRNEGLQHLKSTPDIQFVQFVDGDCTLATGWLEAAIEVLQHCDDLEVYTKARK